MLNDFHDRLISTLISTMSRTNRVGFFAVMIFAKFRTSAFNVSALGW
jgi:hypothetical protein